MGDKKRLLILTGAGATIPWGAPKTSEITSRIISDKAFRTINGEPLALYIIDKLKTHYEYEPDQVGFEMVLNAIEDLHSYFSSMNISSINKYKSNKPVFFDVKENFYKEVLDFESIYEKDRNNQFSTSFWYKWGDTAQFFKSFYTFCINIIGNQIKEYSTREKIDSKQTLNKNFTAYLNKYMRDDYFIRYYTLNYDKIHLGLSSINFFEGFSDSKIDIAKISTDFSINTFYNLHGSLFYKAKLNDWILLNKIPEILTTEQLTANQEGDIILKSPILTGLKKASQILSQPSHSFFNSFLYDYMNADEVHIIGYSFSDIHLNTIFKYPTKAKSIEIIDYINSYDSAQFEFVDLLDNDKRRVNRFLGGYLPIMNAFEVLNSNSDVLDKVKVYVKGFEKYLESTHV